MKDGNDPYPTRATLDYVIDIHTSDIKDAGSDSKIYLSLDGTNGSSEERYLTRDQYYKSVNNKYTFERNYTDSWIFPLLDLGDFTKAYIRKDNSGDSPGWHLDQILATAYHKGSIVGQWMFICNAWLNTYSNDSLEYFMYPESQQCQKP